MSFTFYTAGFVLIWRASGRGYVQSTLKRQTAKHDKHYTISSIAAHPSKNARMRHARFVIGKEEKSVENTGPALADGLMEFPLV